MSSQTTAAPGTHQKRARTEALSIVFVTAAAGAGTKAAPYGAATVASALKARAGLTDRIRVSIVESLPGDDTADLAARVLALDPQVLGFSVYSWNRGPLGSLARLLKEKLGSALFVAGGPETSADPAGVMADGLGDLAIAGEGEVAMAELMDSLLRLRDAKGSGTPVSELPEFGTIIRPAPLNPSLLRSPWLDGTLDPAGWGGAALELARGCPFRCSFCFESKGTFRVRRFPLARTASELQSFRQAGIQEVFVLDPTFNADSGRMAEAVRLMADKGAGLRYILELRAELLDRNQAKLLASLDCSVQIGLQSSDPAVLAAVDRSFDPAIFTRKLRLLEEYGVVYGLDLIYGLPGDTLEGFLGSLDYALALRPNHLDVFRLAVLPGTALSDRAQDHGLVYDLLAPHLVRSTPGFPAEALDRADRLAAALDLLYNRGRAVVWFAALCRTLGMRPSAVVAAFADSVQAASLGSRTGTAGPQTSTAATNISSGPSGTATYGSANQKGIEAASIQFFTGLVGARRGAKAGTRAEERSRVLAGATADLIRTSGAWTRALAEGESTELQLGWNPEDLLNYAAADPRRFVAEFASRPGHWTCEPGSSGPYFTPKKTAATRAARRRP